MNRELPAVLKHNLLIGFDGVGTRDARERCDCIDCMQLKDRRDSIFSKPFQKLKRWYNINHR